MKKGTLQTLALLGLSSAALLSAQHDASPNMQALVAVSNNDQYAKRMTPAEQEFCNRLNLKAQGMFREMNAEGRSLAMNMAESSCRGQNSCKGKGNCKTDKHSCKGRNSCKGQGGCAMDVNKAVETASLEMAQKRKSAYQ